MGTVSQIIDQANNAWDNMWLAYSEYDDTAASRYKSAYEDAVSSIWPRTIDEYQPVFKKAVNGQEVAILVSTRSRRRWRSVEIFIFIGDPADYQAAKYGGIDDICDRSTGKIGLRGLRMISQQIPDIVSWVFRNLSWCDTVCCTPYDEKRGRAYKWLTRLGFRWEPGEGSYVMRRVQ